jgi:hypothetical protein
VLKIISGAQTGVDRAALDAAMTCGIKVGGWCPQERIAEDGVIADRYPVTELANAGYSERTLQNVIDSDGTLIIYFAYLSGGTEETLGFCIAQSKPYLLIDGEELSTQRASQRLRRFIEDKAIAILNVAGPRASGEARAYDYTNDVILQMLSPK